MKLKNKIKSLFPTEKINFYCIMFEGMFNSLGNNLLGLTSIVPLFLSEYGASLVIIGMINTIQSITRAIVPLLAGDYITFAKSKRSISLWANGTARTLILLIPLALFLNFNNVVIIVVFMMVIFIRSLTQPVTGLTWNYLLNDCVLPKDRGKLLGTLFALSGAVGLFSSYFIKVIRGSETLPSNMKYAYIFLMAGVFMASSVLFFLPLKEHKNVNTEHKKRNIKEYTKSLLGCFKNKDYVKILRTNVLSNTSLTLNTFIFIYAQNIINLSTDQISNMIIFQTVGLIAGGLITGQIASKFGTKRMLLLVEATGLLVPVLAFISFFIPNPYLLMSIAVFFVTFARSGQLGYNNYVMDITDKSEIIFTMVTKSIILLPVSFLSIFAGSFIENVSILPVFAVQIVCSLAALILASRLKLVVHTDQPEITKEAA